LANLGLSILQAGPLLKPVLLRAMRSQFLGDKSPTTNSTNYITTFVSKIWRVFFCGPLAKLGLSFLQAILVESLEKFENFLENTVPTQQYFSLT